MKACLIAPAPDLEKYVDEHADHHLVLAHLLQLPGYAAFYAKRAIKYGEYVILDNSAKELGQGVPVDDLLEMAQAIGASEVVLPDVLFNEYATLAATEAALKHLLRIRREWDRPLTTHLDSLNFAIVPQGETLGEWLTCLWSLLNLCDAYGLRNDQVVINVPYHCDHRFPNGGLEKCLQEAGQYGQTIHFLGLPRKLRSVRKIRESGVHIRSIDSSRPFVYGKSGLAMMGLNGLQPPYPNRGEDFFTASTDVRHDEVVWHNIRLFRELVGDES